MEEGKEGRKGKREGGGRGKQGMKGNREENTNGYSLAILL